MRRLALVLAVLLTSAVALGAAPSLKVTPLNSGVFLSVDLPAGTQGGCYAVMTGKGQYAIVKAVEVDGKLVFYGSMMLLSDQPTPPVPPEPPVPPPDPPVPPVPPVVESLWITVIEESEIRPPFPPYDSKEMRDYITTKGYHWRMADKDSTSPKMKNYIDRAKEANKWPYVILSYPKRANPVIYEGQMPTDAKEALALIKKYGG